MKKSLLLLITICSLCLLDGCGGGSSTPSPVATHFSVTAPSSVASGSSFALSVTALDAHNNLAAHYAGTVHFTSTDAQATLPPDSTYDAVAAMFTVALNTTGNQTITVTDTMQSKIVGVTTPISVSAPTAAKFLLSTPFSATAGTSFTFTVTAVDSTGATFTGYAGTVTFTSSDPQAQLPANSTLMNGTASFSATLNTLGNQTLTATGSDTTSVTGASPVHVLAPASGFTPTGNMTNAREVHTATLLNDGKVLIVGGTQWSFTLGPQCFPNRGCYILTPLASAEIYDPAAGTFSLTGNMSVNRVFHTATMLSDGKVLIAGGDDGHKPTTDAGTTYPTAEIYDPGTGVFTLTGTMAYARSGHTATLLTNGKVLLAGGANGNLPTAELYDPATGQFTTTGSMITGRFFHTATLLNDGRVLLAGGNVLDDSGATATAELYDPATGTFTATGNMVVALGSHRATLLQNGTVLITGGAMPSTQLFNPATGTFAPTGAMMTARGGHTATLLMTGKVLVTGGYDITNGNHLATAELFDPATATFAPAGNMEIERAAHAAILLQNSKVLITGGINADNFAKKNSLASAELFP